jgi:hypothetical protein
MEQYIIEKDFEGINHDLIDALSWNLAGCAEENYETSQLGQSVS